MGCVGCASRDGSREVRACARGFLGASPSCCLAAYSVSSGLMCACLLGVGRGYWSVDGGLLGGGRRSRCVRSWS